MKSKATERFWNRYRALPPPIQRLADKSYRLWLDNHHHPSLGFNKLKGKSDRFSVRVGNHHRALGRLIGSDTIEWVWIGTHKEYNKLCGRI